MIVETRGLGQHKGNVKVGYGRYIYNIYIYIMHASMQWHVIAIPILSQSLQKAMVKTGQNLKP